MHELPPTELPLTEEQEAQHEPIGDAEVLQVVQKAY